MAVIPSFFRWIASSTFQLESGQRRNMKGEGLTNLYGREVVGLINCMILVRLSLSNAVSSGSIAEAFLLREGGAVGTETLRMLFTARVR